MASPVQMELSPPETLVECDPESTQLSASTLLQSGALSSSYIMALWQSEVLVLVQLWLLCLPQSAPFSVPEKRHMSLP